MIVLDTTVLVYAVGDEHPCAEPCRALIRRLAAGDLMATTTPEVLQELAHVRARRRGRADAVAIAESYRTLLSPLTVVTSADLHAGLELFARIPELGAFDAVLAATAMARGCRLLASADRAFAAVPGLVLADPSDPAFLDRVMASAS